MTKWKGVAASCAPLVGEILPSLSLSTSTVALSAALWLAIPAGAYAGACTETPAGSGNWVCSGPADPTTDTTQTITGNTLTITTQDGFGLNASTGDAFTINNGAAGTDLVFTDSYAADIIGADAGIDAYNFGTGALSITTTGTVTGINDFGIYAKSSAAGTDLTVESDKVVGGTFGIFAYNKGTGALSVTATGAVTGANNSGMFTVNTAAGTDLTIAMVDVTGNYSGISAVSNGSGALSITSTGVVTGSNHDGINADNSAAGTDLSINVVDVAGGDDGINATNLGTGSLSITSTGIVTGTNSDGIDARNNGTDLIIAAVDVEGGSYGIYAENYGTGAVSITSTGMVTATIRDGIDAYNSAAGTDLIIAAVDVTGNYNGIDARNYGSGSLSITSTGTVAGTNDDGIHAWNFNGTDLSINVVDVAGNSNGINAVSNGSGALSITSTGTVTGLNYDGINADNSAAGTDLSINAIDVSGGSDGINARNLGTGSLSITATGTVTGANDSGILAYNSVVGTDLTIVAVDVTSGGHGVYALNAGSGLVSVTTIGDVTGTSLTGIHAESATNAVVDISGMVTGGNGTAIDMQNVPGQSRLVLHAGWGLSGQALAPVGDMDDILQLASSEDSAIDLSTIGDPANPNGIIGFENLLKTGGNTWTATGTQTMGGFLTAEIVDGALLMDNATLLMDPAGGPVLIHSGATLGVTGASTLAGSLGSAGTVNMADGTAGDVLTIDGDYSGIGGTLVLDTELGGDASPTDKVMVTGSTGGTTTVMVDNAGGGGAQTQNGIEIIGIGGASVGAFLLDGDYVTTGGEEAVMAGAFGYTLEQDMDGDWRLVSQFAPSAPAYEVYPQTLLALNGLPTLRQRVGKRHRGIPIRSEGRAGLEPSAAWARIEGTHGEFTPDVTTTGADYTTDLWRLQAGVDAFVHEGNTGRWVGGLMMHYGSAGTEFGSAVGAGQIDTEGYGIGATLTWYGDSGAYVDAQGQLSWYDSSLTSDMLSQTLVDGHDGFGYALSLETGRRFALTSEWSLTPQAQLTYSRVRFDTFTGPNGAQVSLDRGESLQGRLGLAAEYEQSWQDASGRARRANFYGIANLHGEFLEGTRVNVSGTSLDNRNDRIWGGLGLGGSYTWDDKYALYGEVSANTSLENFGDSYAFNAQVGFRMQW